MQKIRIYYNKSGQIVYHIGLEGPGEFPKTVEQEKIEHPEAIGVLILDDSAMIDNYMRTSGSRIENGELILGIKTVLPPPILPRDPLKELDALKAKLKAAGIAV